VFKLRVSTGIGATHWTTNTLRLSKEMLAHAAASLVADEVAVVVVTADGLAACG